eukprot:gnl/TRDRNA2_/TRDRNA2_139057_c0_seq1.p1 gnl/TRDRNA2_/TRDRNA2_139057_c0~~gnl/TRDRNA2_/TRDRNA2_139057_c0_seq1.p1  ORF type:complete len:251 (-),score=41.59 gnl/TRDRNA2_/TRDRNA2_139057_c0_seq1:354-1106(-)
MRLARLTRLSGGRLTDGKRANASAANLWQGAVSAPPDPILSLVEAYKSSTAARKVNLAQGAYRDETGKPVVLQSTRIAERAIAADNALDKEYLPIEGDAEFRRQTAKFAFGESAAALTEGRVATVQTLSGTGALRVCAGLLKSVGGCERIVLPNPSWGNHAKVFAAAGLQVEKHRYIDSTNTVLDFNGMVEDLSQLPEGSAVLLHACAHNPTGCDPSEDQWRTLAELFSRHRLVPVFDSAYQGQLFCSPL